jgi:hypothetical protein
MSRVKPSSASAGETIVASFSVIRVRRDGC